MPIDLELVLTQSQQITLSVSEPADEIKAALAPVIAGVSNDSYGLADGTLPTEMVVKQNGVWVRATWSQFVTWMGSGLVASELTDDFGNVLTFDNGAILTTDGVAAGGTAPVDALLVSNKLSEFSGSVTTQDQVQSNLGLTVGDITAVYNAAKT